MNERRKWKRYNIAYPAESAEDKKELILTDVSKGGISFNVDRKVDENEKITLKLFLKKKMYSIKAFVVHAKKLKNDIYKIGATFLEVPKDFPEELEREVEEITQFHRECNLYKNRDLSFERASIEYLRDTPASKMSEEYASPAEK
ncbi:MAG: PilZ domain-containing protein [Candidatus Omnitrophota bacterium]